jgi:hypothetical protein
MGNRRKVGVAKDNFGIQSFWGGHGKISPRSRLMPKGTVCPEFSIQQTSRVLTIITHKSLTIWSWIMDHRKAKRVAYQNGIRHFWSFGLSETQKRGSSQLGLSETQKRGSSQPLFCPEQNSAAKLIVKIP